METSRRGELPQRVRTRWEPDAESTPKIPPEPLTERLMAFVETN